MRISSRAAVGYWARGRHRMQWSSVWKRTAWGMIVWTASPTLRRTDAAAWWAHTRRGAARHLALSASARAPTACHGGAHHGPPLWWAFVLASRLEPQVSRGVRPAFTAPLARTRAYVTWCASPGA